MFILPGIAALYKIGSCNAIDTECRISYVNVVDMYRKDIEIYRKDIEIYRW